MRLVEQIHPFVAFFFFLFLLIFLVNKIIDLATNNDGLPTNQPNDLIGNHIGAYSEYNKNEFNSSDFFVESEAKLSHNIL